MNEVEIGQHRRNIKRANHIGFINRPACIMPTFSISVFKYCYNTCIVPAFLNKLTPSKFWPHWVSIPIKSTFEGGIFPRL